jgi:ATP-dependent DNA helicase RecQ
MLRKDNEAYVASRPEPGQYPPLDVDGLARRAGVERAKLKTMIDYAYHPRCRRSFVLDYFGDQERRRGCSGCDNCEAVASGRTTGLSAAEQQAIRRLLLLVGALSGRFGRTRVAALATGSDDDDRFAELPERGTLHTWSTKLVLDLLRALEGAGLIEASRGEYPTIATTRKGDQVAAGRLDPSDLGVQMPTVTKRKPRKRT